MKLPILQTIFTSVNENFKMHAIKLLAVCDLSDIKRSAAPHIFIRDRALLLVFPILRKRPISCEWSSSIVNSQNRLLKALRAEGVPAMDDPRTNARVFSQLFDKLNKFNGRLQWKCKNGNI